MILGRENISYYVFNTKVERKGFCKHCGVQLFNEENPLSGKPVSRRCGSNRQCQSLASFPFPDLTVGKIYR